VRAAALAAAALLAGCTASAATFAPPPGAADPQATEATVCVRGATLAERARDTYELRDRVYRAYGLERRHRRGWRIDHMIPLELGGLTTEANLWPQPVAESYRKDADEDALHEAVCAGRLSLREAQARMLRRWGPRALTNSRLPVYH
jgi:hypothetical protein